MCPVCLTTLAVTATATTGIGAAAIAGVRKLVTGGRRRSRCADAQVGCLADGTGSRADRGSASVVPSSEPTGVQSG